MEAAQSLCVMLFRVALVEGVSDGFVCIADVANAEFETVALFLETVALLL